MIAISHLMKTKLCVHEFTSDGRSKMSADHMEQRLQKLERENEKLRRRLRSQQLRQEFTEEPDVPDQKTLH